MLSSIEFKYDQEDAASLSQFILPAPVSPRAKKIRRMVWLGVVMYGAVLAAGVWMKWPARVVDVLFLPLVILFVLGWVFAFLNSMSRAGYMNRNPRVTAAWDEIGITLSTRRRSELCAWADVESLVTAERGAYLRKRGGGGLLLPQRAFADAAELGAAVDWFKGRIAEASSRVQQSADRSVSAIPVDVPTPQARERFEKIGIALVVGSWLLVLVFLSIGVTYFHRAPAAAVFVPIALLHLMQVAGACYWARSRGFRAVHGLVGLFPLMGVIFIASRAKPQPGEVVARHTWRGFLTCPLAKQSELSGWDRG